jgi:hypothetical protein
LGNMSIMIHSAMTGSLISRKEKGILVHINNFKEVDFFKTFSSLMRHMNLFLLRPMYICSTVFNKWKVITAFKISKMERLICCWNKNLYSTSNCRAWIFLKRRK